MVLIEREKGPEGGEEYLYCVVDFYVIGAAILEPLRCKPFRDCVCRTACPSFHPLVGTMQIRNRMFAPETFGGGFCRHADSVSGRMAQGSRDFKIRYFKGEFAKLGCPNSGGISNYYV